MKRYIVDYDDTQSPPAGTDATAAAVSGLLDLRKKGNAILESASPFTYPLANRIIVKQGSIITLFNGEWRSFEVDADAALGAADLDTGNAFSVGTDYYVYLVDDNADGKFVISANATYPQGETADNTRKIGGFHFGHVRCVKPIHRGVVPINSSGVAFGSGWQQNVAVGIVWNSVWDLSNRPGCSPEGMAKVGNIWVDIYQSSAAEAVSFESATNGLFVAEGRLQSKYGQLPITGIEGLNWYSFAELAARSNKRMLSYAEWVQGAYGNPGGQNLQNQFGGTHNNARTRTGCNVDPAAGLYIPTGGIKAYAVSAYNLVDCVGNVYEWIGELSIWDDGSTAIGWKDVLGADKGLLLATNNTGLRALDCGGSTAAVQAGSRTVCVDRCPWNVRTEIGCRLACDKLAG